MKKLFPQFKPAFDFCKKNKGLFILSCFVDVVFFLVLVAVNYVVFVGMQEYVLRFVDAVEESLGSIAQQDIAAVSPDLLGRPEIASAYHMILKYMVVLVLLAFLAWLVFKGINWFIANKIVRSVKIKDFIRQFLVSSLLAFVCAFVIALVAGRLIAYGSFSFLPLIGSSGARVVVFVLVWLLAYFVALAYSGVQLRKLFGFSIRNYKVLVPAHLFVFLGFFILSYLTVESIRLNYWAPVFFALFITVPFLAFGRIYIVVVVNKLLKRGR